MAVKVLYIFSVLLIVAVTVLAALGEYGQGWEVQLLPSLLPSSGMLGFPQSTSGSQDMERSIQLPLTCSWDARGTLCVMPPH